MKINKLTSKPNDNNEQKRMYRKSDSHNWH